MIDDRYFAEAFRVNPGPMTLSTVLAGRVLDVNESFLRILGYTREQVIGRTGADLDIWVDRELNRGRIIETLMRDGRMRDIPARFRTSAGEVRAFLINAALIDDPEEPLLLLAATDLTDFYRMEAALKVSETRYRQFIDDLPVGVLITQEGNIKYANPAMHSLVGYTDEALFGKPFLPMVYEGDHDWVIDLHRKRMRGEPIPNNYECRYVTRTGDVRQVRLVTRTIDWDGPAAHGVVTDITELKQVEEKLRQAKTVAEEASLAKSRFLAAASHDLRQPIQAIGLFLDTLQRTVLDPQQQAITRNLASSAQALSELLNELLDISKLDAGIVKPQLETVDLFDIFQRLDGEYAALARDKRLRFMLHFPQRTVRFRSDRNLLLVILRNLLGNALRYTAQGGVLVGARLRRDCLVFQVWDTGIGIAPEHLEKIYDEYFQVGNPHRDRSRGIGLGLSIVKRLVALLGYALECRSQPGRGSVFELRVALENDSGFEMPEPDAVASPEAKDQDSIAGLRLTIIEDDALVSEALVLWLQAQGARVTAYADAGAALACPTIEAADVYVSDLWLPGEMDGSVLLGEIQRRVGRPIRGIIVTGDTSAEQIDRLAGSEWRVLHKPLEPARLRAAIAAMMVPGGR